MCCKVTDFIPHGKSRLPNFADCNKGGFGVTDAWSDAMQNGISNYGSAVLPLPEKRELVCR